MTDLASRGKVDDKLKNFNLDLRCNKLTLWTDEGTVG